MADRETEADKEMSFHVQDIGELSLMVVVHTAKDPPASAWARYEQAIRDERRRAGDNFQRVRTLVISDGGAPDTEQRSRIQNEIWEGRAMKMSLLTNSLSNPVKRGIAVALTWMNQGFKICTPDDLHGALTHLELLHALDSVWATCTRLQATLPPIGTLEGIARNLRRPVPAAKSAQRTV
jgi:hypothetical protein